MVKVVANMGTSNFAPATPTAKATVRKYRLTPLVVLVTTERTSRHPSEYLDLKADGAIGVLINLTVHHGPHGVRSFIFHGLNIGPTNTSVDSAAADLLLIQSGNSYLNHFKSMIQV